MLLISKPNRIVTRHSRQECHDLSFDNGLKDGIRFEKGQVEQFAGED
jgi:hypothetical protein